MAKLRVTGHDLVTEEKIDHLGHMNVRYYAENALRATSTVLDDLGVSGTEVAVDELYTRHHREQHLGSSLEVRSGVCAVSSTRLRLYHELVNADDGSMAATFVHGLGAGAGLEPAVLRRAEEQIVEIPDHGRPRSVHLDVDPLRGAPDLATLQQRGLVMRMPRNVLPQECDADGHYLPEMIPALFWGGHGAGDAITDELLDGPNGERMGWATMESRVAIGRLPDVDDRIQSFGAVVGLTDKASHRNQWAFDLTTGELLATFEVVGVAFDVVGRRAMSIVPAARRREEAVLHPDLAP